MKKLIDRLVDANGYFVMGKSDILALQLNHKFGGYSVVIWIAGHPHRIWGTK